LALRDKRSLSASAPTFINIRTVIGVGSAAAGNAKAHGAAFGLADVANIKRTFGLDGETQFFIPQTVYDFFRDVQSRGDKYEAQWSALVNSYSQDYPDLAEEFKLRVNGKMPRDWSKYSYLPEVMSRR
jgi:dihydroxyacetone synthase